MKYFNYIKRAIRLLEFPKHLRSFANRVLKNHKLSGKDHQLYDEYISFIYDNLWDDEKIRSMFPNFIFTCSQGPRQSVLIRIWTMKEVSTENGAIFRSSADIKLKVFGQERTLHWSSHAIKRILERSGDSSSVIGIAHSIYFLNWFKIGVDNEQKLYILIYVPNPNDESKVNLVGAAPIYIEDGRLIAKTFMPPHYCKKAWSEYDETIDKPEDYSIVFEEKNEDMGWHSANYAKGTKDEALSASFY
jgi:hypothetical protein